MPDPKARASGAGNRGRPEPKPGDPMKTGTPGTNAFAAATVSFASTAVAAPGGDSVVGTGPIVQGKRGDTVHIATSARVPADGGVWHGL